MPTEAAGDPELVRAKLERGMNVMRINCAHDAPPETMSRPSAATEDDGVAQAVRGFPLMAPPARCLTIMS